jgi:osmoprotectant transport system permease protein
MMLLGWSNLFEVLPTRLGWHIVLTMLAVSAGLAISLPLGIAASRRAWLRGPVLLVVSVIQTVPSLALLALIFAGLVVLRDVLPEGWRFSALGFWPTIVALTLYSLLPMLRNTVAGLRGVDSAVIEAGRAMGMTARQRLWQIELPLALPMMAAGLRTATVWTVGIATLSTPIGQTSLGDYIFGGLQTFNLQAILLGCVAAAVLAITLDLLLGGIESALKTRRTRIATGLAGLMLGVGVLGVILLFTSGQWARGGDRPYIVGAKNFTEQFILADLIEQRLAGAGLDATQKPSLGSMTIFDALAAGEVDVYVDYTGTLWANAMGRQPGPAPEVVVEQTRDWLKQTHGITLLGTLGFENAYAIAVRQDFADASGLKSIDDLAANLDGTGDPLRLGSDIEFFQRPEWQRVRDAYGLQNIEEVSMSPDLMYGALKQGEVDAITAFTSDGRIVSYGLQLLDDPRDAFPPYDAVLLLSRRAAADEALVDALLPMVDAIDLQAMQEANLSVDEGRATHAEAAAKLFTK